MKHIPEQYVTQHNKNKRIKSTNIVRAVAGILLLSIAVGGFIRHSNNEKIIAHRVVTIEEQASAKVFDDKKKSVRIQVLNGGGMVGQGEAVVKALEDAGYVSENITSADAASVDNQNTTITSRADFEEIVMNIKEILKPILSEIEDGKLNTNPNVGSQFDVIVITGGKKNGANFPAHTSASKE